MAGWVRYHFPRIYRTGVIATIIIVVLGGGKRGGEIMVQMTGAEDTNDTR